MCVLDIGMNIIFFLHMSIDDFREPIGISSVQIFIRLLAIQHSNILRNWFCLLIDIHIIENLSRNDNFHSSSAVTAAAVEEEAEIPLLLHLFTEKCEWTYLSPYEYFGAVVIE